MLARPQSLSLSASPAFGAGEGNVDRLPIPSQPPGQGEGAEEELCPCGFLGHPSVAPWKLTSG